MSLIVLEEGISTRLKYAIFQHFYRRTNSQTNSRREGGIKAVYS
jgi:hypothetical protein